MAIKTGTVFRLLVVAICVANINPFPSITPFPNIFFPTKPPEAEKSLVLLHVLFRHGNRTADSVLELYPNDPYINETYFPIGLGQLTNAGKQKEFSIGQALRNRYNAFLGDFYYPQIIDPWTTNYNRTKMSLQLVLASLFPPRKSQIWNRNLNWQPVPFNYVKRSEDKILLGTLCPHYDYLYKQNGLTSKQQAEYSKYKEEFAYISRNSGLNVTSFFEVYQLFFGMATEEEYGFKLPKWTQKVWPKIITDLAIKEYGVAMANTDLRKMASGYFVQKIVEDTRRKIQEGARQNGRKMYMYSAHENNIAELLILLNLFDPPHVPTYGSYVVFEVHNINNVYGIKIYYENYTTSKLQLLKLQSCDTFCPLDKFVALVEEYFPTDNMCYQSPTANDHTRIYFYDD